MKGFNRNIRSESYDTNDSSYDLNTASRDDESDATSRRSGKSSIRAPIIEESNDDIERENTATSNIAPPEPDIETVNNTSYKEVQNLQLLLSDLTRRLHNAQHTIESQKRAMKNSTATAEIFRSQLSSMSNVLRLETARNNTYMKKKIKDEESQRYENDKKKSNKAHEELRMAMIDHGITGMKREPVKLVKLKSKLEKLEQQQESQKLLLQHLVELEKMTEDLSSAAQMGDLISCQTLLRRGANVNEIDSAGFLPIHYACSNGFVDIVKLLLEYGSDPSAYLTGHSPLEMAARNGHSEAIKILVAFGAFIDEKGLAGSPPIVSATSGGFYQCVADIIDLGADINSYNHEENTSLHVATKLTDPTGMIRLLLKNGANMKAVNRIGHTPLKMALTLVNIPSIEALGGRGGLVDLDDDDDNDYNNNDIRQMNDNKGSDIMTSDMKSFKDNASLTSTITMENTLDYSSKYK